MSKTDNTRPYALQANDKSLPGYINHRCGVNKPCDYSPANGVWVLGSGCFRRTFYYGGIQEDSKGPRRLSKRLDSRERRYAARRALQRLMDPEDFDILPVRADRGDHSWFD